MQDASYSADKKSACQGKNQQTEIKFDYWTEVSFLPQSFNTKNYNTFQLLIGSRQQVVESPLAGPNLFGNRRQKPKTKSIFDFSNTIETFHKNLKKTTLTVNQNFQEENFWINTKWTDSDKSSL